MTFKSLRGALASSSWAALAVLTQVHAADTAYSASAALTHVGASLSAAGLDHAVTTVAPQAASASLLGLTIVCPATISEHQTGECTATASYSDGSSQAVTPTWSSASSSVLAVDFLGNLTAQAVSTATPVAITGRYSANGTAVSQTFTVSVIPPHLLSGVTVTCPSTLYQNQTAICHAAASFSDGSTQAVTPLWSSANNAVLYVAADGSLRAQNVLAVTTAMVTASYDYLGVTKAQSASVLVEPMQLAPPQIKVLSASSSGVTANVIPSSPEVGMTESIWMGAMYQGALYMRNGSAWQLYTSGIYPVAIPALQLAAENTVDVVDQIDITNLVGLQLYVGFGNNWDDMLGTPGKLALIYTVPAPALAGIVLSSSTVTTDSIVVIKPVPSMASLGTCNSSNTNIAGVQGNQVFPLTPGSVKIICGDGINEVSTTLTVTTSPLTGIEIEPSVISVGATSVAIPKPLDANLGQCTSSSTNIATTEGDDGALILGLNPGTAVIRCGSQSATITVNPVPLTGLSLQAASLVAGQTTQLVPTPAWGTLGVCTSSNSSVATIQGSTVQAVGAGTATITCAGQSTTLTVVSQQSVCLTTPAGTYSGNLTGSYTGTASMTLTAAGGGAYTVSGTLSVTGIPNGSFSGNAQPPTIDLVGYCSSGNGVFIQCFDAVATLNNNVITGLYTTANNGSGAFILAKVCPAI